ncbi:hypothetical protein MMC31_002684, partial [Peltigera leucophlebia]|nr:hypothetical protein [Peltigera leucophlebia]
MPKEETRHQTAKPATSTYPTPSSSTETGHQSAKPPRKPLLYLTAPKPPQRADG